MSDRRYQPLKQEPPIKQEFFTGDLFQNPFSPVDGFSRTVDPGFESGSFPLTMSHQYSSQSYSSDSTQDSNTYSISTQDISGYYDQHTEQWNDFDHKDEYATSPIQDVSFPSYMPRHYEHPYLDNNQLDTPRRTDSQPLTAMRGSGRTDDIAMQVSSSYRLSPPADQGSTINQQSPVRMIRQSSNTSGKGELWQCLKCTSHFTRCADLTRHYTTVHNPNPEKYDCKRKNCTRVGENGFTRKDHLKEHLRQYHHDTTVPKRSRK